MTFSSPRGVYRWSVIGGLISAMMAAVSFKHEAYGPGAWLIFLAVMMGIQAMVAAHDASMLPRRPDPPDSTRPGGLS